MLSLAFQAMRNLSKKPMRWLGWGLERPGMAFELLIFQLVQWPLGVLGDSGGLAGLPIPQLVQCGLGRVHVVERLAGLPIPQLVQ